jgi:hypothetical protein
MLYFKIGDLIISDQDLFPRAGRVGRVVGEEMMGRIKLLVIEWIDGVVSPVGSRTSHRPSWLNAAGFRKIKEEA